LIAPLKGYSGRNVAKERKYEEKLGAKGGEKKISIEKTYPRSQRETGYKQKANWREKKKRQLPSKSLGVPLNLMELNMQTTAKYNWKKTKNQKHNSYIRKGKRNEKRAHRIKRKSQSRSCQTYFQTGTLETEGRNLSKRGKGYPCV